MVTMSSGCEVGTRLKNDACAEMQILTMNPLFHSDGSRVLHDGERNLRGGWHDQAVEVVSFGFGPLGRAL